MQRDVSYWTTLLSGLYRPYKTLKQARKFGSGLVSEETPIFIVDSDRLERAEMTDQEKFEYHEREMLHHGEQAQLMRKKMGL
jgi:hypothetical protein